MVKYILIETKVIAEYKSLKEAEANKNNNKLWHPENEYIVEKA